MAKAKFRIVKYNDDFTNFQVLEVCHSYKEADDRFDYWDEKHPFGYIEILTPDDMKIVSYNNNNSFAFAS
jgi:hypothetical protein